MNFIKDVLGESLIKKQTKNLFGNQLIVANSISNNKLKIEFEKKNEDIDKFDTTKVTKNYLNKIRGFL